jgi:hypothetical protein
MAGREGRKAGRKGSNVRGGRTRSKEGSSEGTEAVKERNGCRRKEGRKGGRETGDQGKKDIYIYIVCVCIYYIVCGGVRTEM